MSGVFGQHAHFSGNHQSSAWFRNFLAVVFGRFDPEIDGILGILDGRLPGCAMGHAAGKLLHVHHVGVVLFAPPDDHLVVVCFQSRAVFLPIADALGNGLNGFVREPFLPVACIIAVALLELAQESCHAERSKRIGQRLAAGGSQFDGIERVSFHPLSLV